MITSTSPSQGELTPAFVFQGRAPPLQLWHHDDDHDDDDEDDDDDDDVDVYDDDDDDVYDDDDVDDNDDNQNERHLSIQSWMVSSLWQFSQSIRSPPFGRSQLMTAKNSYMY